MDPNSIIKLVRQQRRQINDSLNSNNNIEIIMDRNNSSSTSSTSSSSSVFSYDSDKQQDISQFLVPTSTYNYTLANRGSLVAAYNQIEEAEAAKTRKSFDYYDSKSSSHFYDYSFEANLIKQRTDLTNSLIEEHRLKKQDDEDLLYHSKNKIQKRNSYNESNLNNSSQINQYHEQSMSRCASVKSVASDSGVGSSSPLSDCSDLGSSNNTNNNNNNSKSAFTKTINNNQKQLLRLNLKQAESQSFEMKMNDSVISNLGRKRKNDYDDVFLNKDDSKQSNYASNHIYLKHSEIMMSNPINNNSSNNNNNERNLIPYQNGKQINSLQNNNIINNSNHQQINSPYSSSNQMKNLSPFQMNFNQVPNQKCTKECCAHLNIPSQTQPRHNLLLNNNNQQPSMPESAINKHPIASIQSGVPVITHKFNDKRSLCDCNECKTFYFNQYLKSNNQAINEKRQMQCNCADPNCIYNNSNNTKPIYLNNNQIRPQEIMLNAYNKVPNGQQMIINQQQQQKQSYPLPSSAPLPHLQQLSTQHIPNLKQQHQQQQQQQHTQQKQLCFCDDCYKVKPSEAEIYKYKLAEQAATSSPVPSNHSLSPYLRPSISSTSSRSSFENYKNITNNNFNNKRDQANIKYNNYNPNNNYNELAFNNNNLLSAQYNNQIIDEDYADLIKNGIQITKQRNHIYENQNSNINNNDSQKYSKNLNSKAVESFYKDIQINNSNMNLITQAKHANLLANNQIKQAKPSNENTDSNLDNVSKGTSIVCLSADDASDFELGEVVQIDKIKNAANVEIINNEAILKQQPNPSEGDIPVTLSKKILPIVKPRIQDWLEKCVDFTNKMKIKTNLSFNVIMELINRAWPRLLLVYMIENSFDFCVTKDMNNSSNDTLDSNNNIQNNSVINKLPKEKDANQLHNIISKGYGFNLKSQEFDLLRELIFFREGGEEPIFYKACLEAQKVLQDTVEANHGKLQFSKLLLFLPSIYNIKTEIIDSLFCRNIHTNYSSVYEFLDSRLRDRLEHK